MLCWSCIENFGSGTRFALDFAIAKSACADACGVGFGRALRALDLDGAKLICTDGYDNFGFGRALRALNFAGATLACAEIERGRLSAPGSADG